MVRSTNGARSWRRRVNVSASSKVLILEKVCGVIS